MTSRQWARLNDEAPQADVPSAWSQLHVNSNTDTVTHASSWARASSSNAVHSAGWAGLVDSSDDSDDDPPMDNVRQVAFAPPSVATLQSDIGGICPTTTLEKIGGTMHHLLNFVKQSNSPADLGWCTLQFDTNLEKLRVPRISLDIWMTSWTIPHSNFMRRSNWDPPIVAILDRWSRTVLKPSDLAQHQHL